LYKKGLHLPREAHGQLVPASLTALSDEEVIMKPQTACSIISRMEVAEQPGTWLTIATTRPNHPRRHRRSREPERRPLRASHRETRAAPAAGADSRRAELIPIVGDDHVDFEFGTGVLKVTPAHDKADFEIGQRHNLARVDIMNPDGTMNALAGEIASPASIVSRRAMSPSTACASWRCWERRAASKQRRLLRARRRADRAATERAVVLEIPERGAGASMRAGPGFKCRFWSRANTPRAVLIFQKQRSKKAQCAFSPNAGPKSTTTGWKASKIGALVASFGGGIEYRSGAQSSRYSAKMKTGLRCHFHSHLSL